MMVTDIVMPEVKFTNNEWTAKNQLQIQIQPILDNLQDKWYKNILSYNHGIYVTAQARNSGLWRAITKMIEAGGEDDILYYDTDSVYYLNPDKYIDVWDELNKERYEQLKDASRRYGIPLERFKPLKPNGEASILGQWEKDKTFKFFKTLGAKKYAYVDNNDELHITVSGVPKRGAKCLNNIEEFDEGFVFDNDTCRKGLSTYLDGDNWSGTFIDGYELNQPYGLNLRNIGYTLGLTNEFKAFVQLMMDWGNL